MKTPRQHLRLDFKRCSQPQAADSRLESSRKRLLALALGASLTGAAGCGDLEPIPEPDTGVVAPMPPPRDAGFLSDAGFLQDSGASSDAGSESDAGEFEDAGEFDDAGATDSGEIPPMPPPRDAGVSERDTGEVPPMPPPRDTGVSPRDTGEVPPMPPPRDTGVSRRDIGQASRDVGRER